MAVLDSPEKFVTTLDKELNEKYIRELRERIMFLESENMELKEQVQLLKTVERIEVVTVLNDKSEISKFNSLSRLKKKKDKGRSVSIREGKKREKKEDGKSPRKTVPRKGKAKSDVYTKVKVDPSKRNALTTEIDDDRIRRKLSGKYGVFGVALNELELVDNMPAMLTDCFDEIRKRGLLQEGIFRIPGNNKVVEYLQGEFDYYVQVDLSDISVNDLTSLVKSFIRSIPNKLIPNIYDGQIPHLIGEMREGKKEESVLLDELQDIVEALPQPNLQIFRGLMAILRDVLEHADKNRMNLENIITCIAPTIGCSTGLLYYTLTQFDYFFSSR